MSSILSARKTELANLRRNLSTISAAWLRKVQHNSKYRKARCLAYSELLRRRHAR